MSESTIIVQPWKPTPEQACAARYLAIGCTLQHSADQARVGLRTVQSWVKKAAFAEYVERLHLSLLERVEASLMANLQLALEVQRQVLNGEVSARDERYAVAHKLIDRLLDKFLIVDPPAPYPALPAPAGPAFAVQINNAGNSGTQPAA